MYFPTSRLMNSSPVTQQFGLAQVAWPQQQGLGQNTVAQKSQTTLRQSGSDSFTFTGKRKRNEGEESAAPSQNTATPQAKPVRDRRAEIKALSRQIKSLAEEAEEVGADSDLAYDAYSRIRPDEAPDRATKKQLKEEAEKKYQQWADLDDERGELLEQRNTVIDQKWELQSRFRLPAQNGSGKWDLRLPNGQNVAGLPQNPTIIIGTLLNMPGYQISKKNFGFVTGVISPSTYIPDINQRFREQKLPYQIIPPTSKEPGGKRGYYCLVNTTTLASSAAG